MLLLLTTTTRLTTCHFQVLTGLFSVTYKPLDNTSDMYREFKEDLIEVADRLNSEEEDEELPPADDPAVN